MKFLLHITHQYLGIPVKTASVKEQDLRTLEIGCQGQKIMEFRIPVTEQTPCAYDYLAYINVEKYQGGELCFDGRLPSAFFEQIIQTDEPKQDAVLRPEIHFTAERGWINDPNGLVYQDGTWHLFFQYNPMNTEWENMSWGHAVSRDLLHWRQLDTVMYPDEHGTVFSGCGLINERGMFGLPKDALLFFYTAAGSTSQWSEGKPFVQRMAYSLDGGKTLIKYQDWELCLYPEAENGQKRDLPEAENSEKEDFLEAEKGQEGKLPKAAFENRDPKIFWHEDSGAYVMVLFLEAHDFAVLRSENLEDWDVTQQMSFDAAWECPDLMKLKADDGTWHWVFWSADGYYFLGEFDGWRFTLHGGQREAYGTKLPYAAQTYSGVQDRTVSVAWLRTRHEGKLYTGAMAVPRELSLVKAGDDYRIRLAPVRELEEHWEPYQRLHMINGCMRSREPGRPFCLLVDWREGEAEKSLLTIGNAVWTIDRKQGTIECRDLPSQTPEIQTPEIYKAPEGETFHQLRVIVDRGIVEITANHDIIYLIYETTDYQMDGFITFEGDEAEIQVALWKSDDQ